MASPSSVLSLGFGSWGSANLLPTLGFGISSAAALVYGPLHIPAAESFIPGAMAAEVFIPGAQAAEAFIPGAVAAEAG